MNIRQTEMDNQTLFVLQDGSGIADNMLLLTPVAAFALQFMDGNHTLLDIKNEIFKNVKLMLKEEEIIALIKHMEDNYFLEGDHFNQKYKKMVEDFIQSSVRKAWIAGKGYPEKREELIAFIEEMAKSTDASLSKSSSDSGKTPKAIIAPHIDLRLGGETYISVYETIKNSAPDTTFIILGICHNGMIEPFSLTKKDFETPLGKACSNKEMISSIAEQLSFDPFIDEFAHRSEHSIEFQVVMLQYFLSDFTIVPILCSFDHFSLQDKKIAQKVESFIQVLQQIITTSSAPVCLIAGVDYAHIGPMYGHPEQPKEQDIEEVLHQDKLMIKTILEKDARGFLSFIQNEDNNRNVCGTAAIYSLLQTLPQGKGALLSHNHAVMDQQNSFVTFAGIKFE